jgi:hypothetical protein
MKTIPLRRLLREPGQVKRWTRSGETVMITDAKQPLWVLRSADTVDSDPSRSLAIDEILDATLASPCSGVGAARLLEESRR